MDVGLTSLYSVLQRIGEKGSNKIKGETFLNVHVFPVIFEVMSRIVGPKVEQVFNVAAHWVLAQSSGHAV